MKLIIKNAVSRLYALLRLKATAPDAYAEQIAFGARYTASWGEPEEP